MINICTASAGAGKTHKLTGEYIKLLFSQPNAYRHILAVTFTNKATDEMKQRILQELYNLSKVGEKSDYLDEIEEFTGKDEAWVRGEAGKILISILHDYTSFRVSTIDKFFQLVMRSFAKELGRMATYNVELDSAGVLTEAVDRMFSDLDDPKNKRLLDWLIDYSLEAIEKGESWSVRNEIISLGGHLFSEEFKLAKEGCSNELLGIEAVAQFKKRIKDEVTKYEGIACSFGKEGLEYLQNNGLEESDFKGKSRNPLVSYLKKLSKIGGDKGPVEYPADSFFEMQDNLDTWYTGKSCPAKIEGAYGFLNELIGKIILHLEGYRSYCTKVALLKNVNVMGILNDIYVRIVDYCREKNIILLSESTELLNRIIDGSDTPFIYEKIGARIDNYMLDEFQDTSVMQWRNFYPLLQNSLAMGHDNLVVGDVKQSIYRWRGSDWQILNSQIKEQFDARQIEISSLNCNWRSGESIVTFNNDFFEYCAKAAQGLYGVADSKVIEEIYTGFKQSVPEKMKQNPGRVEVAFVEGEELSFEESVLQMLPAKVEELIGAGYRQRDIAILVRNGREGNAVAENLISCGYDIISSDSLYVSSSEAVQKVVNILREVDNSQSEILRVLKRFNEIPAIEDMQKYSLYQLCETIIRESLTEMERKDVAFLQAFLDIVLEYAVSNGTNISQFVAWWDEQGVKKSISAPDDMDAIRVMTIHKSKGLGFNVVVVPFLKESLDHLSGRQPNLWQKYEGNLISVKYTKDLLNTDFAPEYKQEKLNKYIDSLNTVYVAFTRTKRELVVFAPPTGVNSKGDYKTPDKISDILFSYYLDKKEQFGWDGFKIEIGERKVEEKVESAGEKLELKGIFNAPVNPARWRTVAQSGSLNGEETIREHGIAMHYVFSLVDYPESIDAAVERACAEGVATCFKEELTQMVKEKIASVSSYGWFGRDWEVKNECAIITEWGGELRPDRVLVNGDKAIVIDYKFGGYSTCDEDTRQHKFYRKQVTMYKDLLVKMGYSNVEGYLWYISANEIIQV